MRNFCLLEITKQLITSSPSPLMNLLEYSPSPLFVWKGQKDTDDYVGIVIHSYCNCTCGWEDGAKSRIYYCITFGICSLLLHALSYNIWFCWHSRDMEWYVSREESLVVSYISGSILDVTSLKVVSWLLAFILVDYWLVDWSCCKPQWLNCCYERILDCVTLLCF